MKDIDVAVIGAGVAGLIVGRRLQEQGVRFVLLDEHARVGDPWRERYESLRLFSTRRFASLPGMRAPGGSRHCPTRTEFADYLEAYATRFRLPVHGSTRVERVRREDDGFLLTLGGPDGDDHLHAERVVVAAGAHRRPVRPPFADLLDPSITQIHSLAYRSMADLPDGPVLVVGAANSGTDIALDAARAGRPVILAGRHPGQTPVDIDTLRGFVGSHVILFGLRHLTVRSRAGRAARERQRGHGLMLIRNRIADLDAAGVVRVGRIEGVRGGLPVPAGAEPVRPAVVVWCTGSRPDLTWLDVEGAVDLDGEPVHEEGVSTVVPGLGFVGLDFQYSAASGTIQGMDRDARAVIEAVLHAPRLAPVAA